MKLSSKDANKMLKGFEQEVYDLLAKENYTRCFTAATTESKEDVRPEYNYESTQKQVAELQQKIRKIKHAINVFNTTTMVDGFNMTIDEMLIYIPQLNKHVQKLQRMKNTESVTRHVHHSSNIIDYSYINYDLDKVTYDYKQASEELNRAHLTLDKINITKEFEVDI